MLRAERGKRVVDVLDPRPIDIRERKAVFGGEVILNRLEILGVQRLALLDAGEGVEDLLGGRLVGEAGGPLPRKQPRHEIGPIRRHLEQRLVDQMQIQIAAPDVDDERHRRLQRRHVGEVLFGTDAHVDAAGLGRLEQLRDHVLKPDLVRQQIVGSERPIRLGEIGDQLPELLVREPRRQRLGGGPHAQQQRHRDQQGRNDRAGKKHETASGHGQDSQRDPMLSPPASQECIEFRGGRMRNVRGGVRLLPDRVEPDGQAG